jgi:hypothetical protein
MNTPLPSKKPGASLAVLLWTLAIGQLAAQTIPPLVNYQGRLSNPDGSPLPTADYTLTFNLYDAATNGALVWGPQVFDGVAAQGHGARIPVVQSYFNVMLGPVDTADRLLSDAFNAPNRFVEIAVSNRPPIAPRQQILTTPFAFQAANAANATKLAGYDWSALFGTNNPVAGTIPLSKLAQRQVGTNLGVGGGRRRSRILSAVVSAATGGPVALRPPAHGVPTVSFSKAGLTSLTGEFVAAVGVHRGLFAGPANDLHEGQVTGRAACRLPQRAGEDFGAQAAKMRRGTRLVVKRKQHRLGDGVGGMGEGRPEQRRWAQELQGRRAVKSHPAAERGEGRALAAGIRRAGQVPLVLDFLQQGDVLPVAFALRFLAAQQVGQGKKREPASAVVAFLAPGEQLLKGRQQMVAPPEFQPFFPAIGQPADDEAAEVARAPGGAFLQGSAGKQWRADERFAQRREVCQGQVQVEIQRVAVHAVEPNGMAAHHEVTQSEFVQGRGELRESGLGVHHSESSRGRLPCANNSRINS